MKIKLISQKHLVGHKLKWCGITRHCKYREGDYILKYLELKKKQKKKKVKVRHMGEWTYKSTFS
jgi:hypothetical protein